MEETKCPFCPQAEEQQAGATAAPKQPQTSGLAAAAALHPPGGHKYGIKGFQSQLIA